MGARTRLLRLGAPLALLGAQLLLGCSQLVAETYYAPNTTGGLGSRAVDRGRLVFATGPPDRVAFERDGVRLEVYDLEPDSTTVSAGPLVFPVLPTFWLPWFFRGGTAWDRPRLSLRVAVEAGEAEVRADLRQAALVEGGRRHAPEHVEARAWGVAFGREDAPLVVPGGRSGWARLVFVYLEQHELEGFRLELPPIEVGGVPLALPPVRFSKARGWVMDLVP